MDTRCYVCTHKQYTEINDDIYHSLHVGREISEDLGYQGDNTGDHISDKNRTFCELTGMYWIWKNVQCDNVAICHYRRYFVYQQDFLRKERIEFLLQRYDVIVPEFYFTNYETVGAHYAGEHHWRDMEVCREILSEKYPDYLTAFDFCMESNVISLGNMIITRKAVYDAYCEWLFDILFEAEKRIDITGYDTYQKRVFGFLAERLQRIWLLQQGYLVYENPVKLTDPSVLIGRYQEIQEKTEILRKEMEPLTVSFQNGTEPDLIEREKVKADIGEKTPIWVCWWQGEDEMPEVVAACFKSLKRNIPPDSAEIHLITLQNVDKYVRFPKFIIEKFQKGFITPTHLSDLLRCALLTDFGGIWIDATYFVASPISDSFVLDSSFYTQKFAYPFYASLISQGRWSGNFLRTEKNNPLTKYLLNAFFAYWSKHDEIFDYYLIDYLIRIAYEDIPAINRMIEACPPSEEGVFEMEQILNQRFHIDRWRLLTEKTTFFKLTYKKEFQKALISGEKTLWGVLAELE